MTESIKQEIINNIFENGDKLITGPILQTVLIDMIDDVNVKDQAILSKTGSWDEAVTQIPNLATKAEVTNLSESIARDLENVVDVDLTGYATEQWVQNQGYLKEHQDISGLATKTELTAAENNLQGNITNLSESVARDIANVSVPEGVATEAWVQSQGYLTEHQDISGLATKTELNEAKDNLQGNITSLSESVARDLANVDVDLTGYATETWVQNQGYLTEHQDISNLATKTELTSVSESVQTDITNLSESVANSAVWKKGTGEDSIVQKLTGANEANTPSATGTGALALGFATTASGQTSHAEGEGTKALEYCSHAEGCATTATGRSSHAEGWSTEATGQSSHAEGEFTIASGDVSHAEGYHTNASGNFSHAEGTYVTASGFYSHAEGDNTKAEGESSHAEGYKASATGRYGHAEGDTSNASGLCSHAEGQSTLSSGQASHAEGFFTVASNDYEHAQGQYNHNSTNQIFSVGAGEKIGETVTRRNAVSILEVPNSETQVVTASVFVQNVGGYDGTNPEPGTNDLATVISEVSSIWEKGTGTDSIVQKLSGDNEANKPTAIGPGAVAIGFETTASGQASHAEGANTVASGDCSHAEGLYTTAFGQASHAEGDHTNAFGDYSHAEGYQTEAPNSYECALGMCNHSSEGQIFSVGAGEGDPDNPFDPKPITRRNAISVLAVPNADTKINTASFFVQNIGGYDGTNPLPGTNDLATVINGISSSGGSSETLWKKGTETDSIVQAIASGAGQPKAGNRAIAVGEFTDASGYCSHAEGYATKALQSWSHAEGDHATASGRYSHAEGARTNALGERSHAEGNYTVASNSYEHAQGRYNHSSENQIFSIGTGNSNTDRRNAVSVLEVDNSGSYTSSFFVQNVGGYDGTNPTPGTNDLATVLNNTETWTFTLDDGSTVTKNVRIS